MEVIKGNKSKHNKNAKLIRREEVNTRNMNWTPIRSEETTFFWSKLITGRLLEPIYIRSYWLKALFAATRSYIMRIFNTVKEKPKPVPHWLTTQTVYLLHKL